MAYFEAELKIMAIKHIVSSFLSGTCICPMVFCPDFTVRLIEMHLNCCN